MRERSALSYLPLMVKRRALFITLNVFSPFFPSRYHESRAQDQMGLVRMKLEKVRYEIENKCRAAHRKQRKAVRPKKQKQQQKNGVCMFALYPALVETLPPIYEVHSGAGMLISCS